MLTFFTKVMSLIVVKKVSVFCSVSEYHVIDWLVNKYELKHAQLWVCNVFNKFILNKFTRFLFECMRKENNYLLLH